MTRRCVMVLTLGALLALPGVAKADFGLVPGSVGVEFENSDGTIDTQAGSHPYAFTVSFRFKLDGKGQIEGGEPDEVITDLPLGLVGNPSAVPRCSRQAFEGLAPSCAPDTQIGVLRVNAVGVGLAVGPVYNMAAPPGETAQLGFSAANANALQGALVKTAEGYRVEVRSLLPLAVSEVSETIWGVPADPGHDPERGEAALTRGGKPLSSSAPLLPYLTLPTSCQSAPEIKVRASSNLDPTFFDEQTAPLLDAASDPVALSGCASVPFSPSAAAQPTSYAAESPTGLDFALSLPDQGLLVPYGVAETEPERVEVALPEGVTANPSAAEGLGACSEAQFDAEAVDTAAGGGCPESSKIGSIVAHSPLIEEPIEGALYLAEPYANPTGSLIGLYVIARAGERGVLIKQAGKVEPDPGTGQLITTFEGLPPLPYSGFTLHFREGARSLLVTPPSCGTYRTVTRLTPFSVPQEPRVVESVFQINGGVEGGPCPPAGVPPLHPAVVAGTQNNAAGSYSPLYLRIERKDGEQEITGFSTQLPPGLSGNLSGIPFCGEAEIQRARQQSGAEAQTAPACPVGSQIGRTVSEAGVGPVLAQTPGKLYLAGPFQGAPFSVVDITSAKVGPFDLGTVVVHLPLNIDPVTAQVSIPSGPADQIPHIIKGIVIHLRTIHTYIDRLGFTLNPTSCQKMSILSDVNGSGGSFASSTDDTTAVVSSRFQAADCASLAFKPTFRVTTSGKTSRKKGAALSVKLTYPKGALGKDANIRSVKVSLPKQLPSRLTTLQKACTNAQFEANPAGCPVASRVGTAKAITPILPVPLEGPAYFVSHGGAKFPELIIVLQGYGVTIDLHGETFINEHTNVTSSTFHTVPDQPVTSFQLTLPQGSNSALAAPSGLCSITTTKIVKKKVIVHSKSGRKRTVTRKVKKTVPTSLVMPTIFTAQNGAVLKQNTPIAVNGCVKGKRGAGKMSSFSR